ncbi:alpha/beta hydrolase [Novosphingobium sp.]|uniref:alpha/beta hydrolase n=1 Tax=Novosphingobium sp. TaxID=1874826 RepID=UPI0027325F4D|nr:alpha/beta hydrolase [Novosphingobium sp.]MDP3906117.1 alpha/beta hydrolase [Novosphingobium sp.]
MNLLKTALLPLAALTLGASATAQLPPPETISPVRRTAVPLGVPCAGAEQWERMFEQVNVRNVTCPAVYPVLPRPGKSNGKSVIVVPGGGYQFVSIEQEGFRVADALAARGYSAFVLKYRTAETPRDNAAYMAKQALLFSSLGKRELADHPPAVDDLAAALRMVRDEAGQRALDPAQIGVIGFSAGARSAIRLLEGRDEGALADNIALIYPPMGHAVNGGPRPPLFLAIAVDDPLFKQGRLGLLSAWLAESPKAEFHLYSAGSHGFGMGTKGTTSDLWIDQYIAWLDRH